VTRSEIPGRDQVLAALAQLRDEAAATGRQPAVLTLARSLGLANTTFRRNFPDIAAELNAEAAQRRHIPPPPSGYQQLQETSTRLRGENRQLRGQLEVAAGVIQRITMENDRLRQELEAAAKVTGIGSAPSRQRGPAAS
jgi:hypothetical protein